MSSRCNKVEGFPAVKKTSRVKDLEAQLQHEQSHYRTLLKQFNNADAELSILRGIVNSQQADIARMISEADDLRSKLTEKKRDCIDLRGDLLQKEAEFRQLLDISEALAKR